MPSSHVGQTVELKAEQITVLGTCNPVDYPFKAKKKHPLDYIRQYPHLRARTTTFASLLRMRNEAAMALHTFYQDEGYIWVHTPVLTTNNCEELGDLFQIEPESYFQSELCSEEGGTSKPTHYFGSPTYLTVSGQLHAEMMACGMTSVYTFGPTFRAEKSQTRRHLSEFWMFEAESCCFESVEDLTEIIERSIKWTVSQLMDKYAEDLHYFHSSFSPTAQVHVDKAVKQEFVRMPYAEAIEVLKQNDDKFQFRPEWGADLQTEHEVYLVKHCGDIPVFVTDFPAELKPFYARDNGNSTVRVLAILMILLSIWMVGGDNLQLVHPRWASLSCGCQILLATKMRNDDRRSDL
jgi:asparaginyl-tRNA synthetase